MDWRQIFSFIPEVKKPEEKKLSFNVKLKWTIVILASFFVLANVPLFGLSTNALARFEYLAIILGTDFGSIISLGVGPIVMASIILQLLVGAQILNIDTTTHEGKKFFQGLQKILVFFFIVFEAAIYVVMQGLQADPNLAYGSQILIFQLILGGLAIFYMDDLSHKWGFGSGVSLFIGAGVSWSLITSAFQFLGKDPVTGKVVIEYSGRFFVLIQSIIERAPIEALSAFATILVTALIFLLVVWAQSLKVEIPLSFGRLRGYSVKWPLVFFYASVIPVILVSALIANIQLFGGLIENTAAPCLADLGGTIDTCTGKAKIASYFTFLGRFQEGVPIKGLAFWMGSTNILGLIIRGGFLPLYLWQAITHTLFFMAFSVIFSIFWVKTSNMDSKAQAKNIMSSGLQVSGFRQDERVLESILDRYIMPLTVMGGAAVGLLASLTNVLGALVSGTAILLVIMIMYQFYQNIAKQHAVDMHPAMRKFMGSLG